MKKNFVSFTPKNQHGFALVVVLITLLILAGVVGSLLSNQTLYLKETSDIMAASQREQDSHNLHNACIAQVRQGLVGANSAPVSNQNVVNWVNDGVNQINVIVGSNSTICNIGVTNLPAVGQTNWTPIFSVSITFGNITETTEFQYAACVVGEDCTGSDAVLNVVNANNATQQVQPQFIAKSVVQTAWTRQLR